MRQAILNMFPLPNFVDPNIATRYNWNCYVAASEPYNRRTEPVRVDYQVKENWQVYVSLSNKADHQYVPYSGGTAGWVAGSLNFVMSPVAYGQPGRLGTLHSTNSISPTLLNETSFAVSQNTLNYTPQYPDLVNRAKLGINIPQRNLALNPLNLIPNMTFGSIQNYANPSMSDGTPYFNQNTIYSFIDNVSKIKGSQVIKAGICFEKTQKIRSAGPPVRGSISFSSDSSNPNNTNSSYVNALLGNYDNYSEALQRPHSEYRFTNTEWFIEDDWKVKSSLTCGLRFYHDMPQYDKRGYISSLSPSAWDPKTALVLLRLAVVNGVNVAQDPTTGKTYGIGLIGTLRAQHRQSGGRAVDRRQGWRPGGLYKT